MPVSFPSTYRVARFEELDGDLTIVSVPWKHPEAGQIVIKTLACGVCHSYVSSSVFYTQTSPSHALNSNSDRE